MTETPETPVKRRYVRAVGPRLKKLLAVVFALFALLGANAVYLLAIRFLGYTTEQSYENFFYMCMFLMHLVLGILIVVPVIVFGAVHIKNAHNRTNRRAVRVGYALFAVAIVLLLSGIVLTRIEGLIEVKNPATRSIAWWLHVITPIAAAWLFILHRLAGPRIRWRVGGMWLAGATAVAVILMAFQSQDPRKWNQVGNPKGDKYFFPSLSRTVTGDFIPAKVLLMDDYCKQCHADAFESWSHSAHRLSSFNNPAYRFSVLNTRKAMFERDGNVQGSRFCAGCHDPVPFFSGAFDDPKFDDPNFDLVSDVNAQAGITCTSCHAITHVNSPRGNADFTIEEPIHYPFALSDSSALRWVNRQLVKAKPEFHKKTFLKPLHKTTEFCGTCHKVHLPVELNKYKWLRGQNHYDAFLLSGVSGHFAQSFYYPPKADPNCNNCHMQLRPSDDFGARVRDDSGQLKIHDHQFPSANTAIPYLLGHPKEAIDAHEKFTQGAVRLDVFAVKKGGTIDGELIAPLRPTVPALEPGKKYLIETVVRTVKMGHLFTQGTADSNEVWVDVEVKSGDRVIGRSGGRASDGEVDPWSHFINVYMLDKNGNRIDRRNAEDIFTPLYNNQIPPGAADVVHYQLEVPADAQGTLTFEAKLRYRKFDTTFMRLFQGEAFKTNDLPIMTIATDSVIFPIAGSTAEAVNPESKIDLWQRWNDYGIGLLRKGSLGELGTARIAFSEVEKLGRPDGPLNLARVYIKEGLVQQDAPQALARAKAIKDPVPPPWTLQWLSGIVSKQNGDYDAAIQNFRSIVDGGFAEAKGRGFDFSKDYVLLNELADSTYKAALRERGNSRLARRKELMAEALAWYQKTLAIDPENVAAHWGLKQVYEDAGLDAKKREHEILHAKYKSDDNAADRAVLIARKANPAADHAAEAIVIYDLARSGAYGLGQGGSVP